MRRTAAFAILATAAAATPKFEDKWEKFCGVPDCYTELGLVPNATKAQIRRQYRTLSLEFHPDKKPGDAAALARFNKIARANEVLTDDELRKKLDYYTENPGEYWSLYGSFIDFKYKPKTDLRFAVFLILLFASLVQPALQLSKHQLYVAQLTKACLMKSRDSSLSADIRLRADEIVKAESAARKKDKSKARMTSKEERELLETTVKDLVAASDLPAEFAYPSAKDTILYKLVAGPLAKFNEQKRAKDIQARLAAGAALSEAEMQELMETYLGGPEEWDALSDKDQDALFAAKCHVKANFDAWRAKNPKAEVAAAKPPSKKELRQRKKGAPAFVMED